MRIGQNKIYLKVILCALIFSFSINSANSDTLLESAKKLKSKDGIIPPGKTLIKREKKSETETKIIVQDEAIKIMILNFDNLSDNPKNDYLSQIITAVLSQELKKSGNYYVSTATTTGDLKSGHSGYQISLETLAKTAILYSSDFIITGYYIVKKDFITIHSKLYINKENRIIKLSVSQNEFKTRLKNILYELALRIESEIIKRMPKQGIKKVVKKKRAPDSHDNYYTGVLGLYGFADSPNKRSTLNPGSAWMVSFMIYWDMGNAGSIAKVPFIKNLSLFTQADLVQGTVSKSLFKSNQPPEGNSYHYAGFLLGLNFRFPLGKYLSLNLNGSAGYSRSQTSRNTSTDRARGIGYFNPRDADEKSHDLYISSMFMFTVELNPNAYLAVTVSYKQIQYSADPLRLMLYQAGGSLRF